MHEEFVRNEDEEGSESCSMPHTSIVRTQTTTDLESMDDGCPAEEMTNKATTFK